MFIMLLRFIHFSRYNPLSTSTSFAISCQACLRRQFKTHPWGMTLWVSLNFIHAFMNSWIVTKLYDIGPPFACQFPTTISQYLWSSVHPALFESLYSYCLTSSKVRKCRFPYMYSGSKNCPNVCLLYKDTCITQCWHNIKSD